MSTPTTGPDEKVCPYCAETIKAAAVRCRFCQSDLPPPPVSPPVSDPPVEVQETDVEDAEPPYDEPSTGTGRPDTRLLVGLVVLCLVLTGALVLLVHRSLHPHLGTAPNGQVTDSSFRNAAMSAASDAAATALSYSYKTFDADRKKARALMSPKLAKQYDGAMDEVAPQTASAKLTLKATVLSAGLLSAEEHEAKVLLFVNTVTTREGSKKQQLDQNRVVMDLTRKDGGWTVSKMDAF
jgi:Mce-associated membrane protein